MIGDSAATAMFLQAVRLFEPCPGTSRQFCRRIYEPPQNQFEAFESKAQLDRCPGDFEDTLPFQAEILSYESKQGPCTDEG